MSCLSDLRRHSGVVGLFACVLLPAASAPAAPQRQVQELTMPAEQFKRLEGLEAHTLKQADGTFKRAMQAREKRAELLEQASKEYDAFLKEYPKSVAVPFALYRKARCLHLDEKRFHAIRAYNEILDYFPNELPYAAAALYLIGQANWESGDKLEARKAWAEMACRPPSPSSNSSSASSALTKVASKATRISTETRARNFTAREAMATLATMALIIVL